LLEDRFGDLVRRQGVTLGCVVSLGSRHLVFQKNVAEKEFGEHRRHTERKCHQEQPRQPAAETAPLAGLAISTLLEAAHRNWNIQADGRRPGSGALGSASSGTEIGPCAHQNSKLPAPISQSGTPAGERAALPLESDPVGRWFSGETPESPASALKLRSRCAAPTRGSDSPSTPPSRSDR